MSKNHLVDWKQEPIKEYNENHREGGLNVRKMHRSALPQICGFGRDKTCQPQNAYYL